MCWWPKAQRFFEAVMFHKAAIHINTIKKETYTKGEVSKLQKKIREFYKSIQDKLKGDGSLIPTIEKATSDPENLFKLLIRYCYYNKILSKQDLYKITHNSDDFVDSESHESELKKLGYI